MKEITMVCTKKIFFRTNGPFWSRKLCYPHNSESTLRFFLKNCRMKGANRYMKILWVVFREKNSFGAIWSFLAFRPFFTLWFGMVKLGQATVNWILKQDMIGILKQWRHNSQVNIYVVDIVWILCDVYVWGSKFRVL